MSTPQPGGPGGEDASSEAGSKSNDGKESRLARIRRRLRRRRSEPSTPESAPPQTPAPPAPPPQAPPPQTPPPQTPPPQTPPPQTPPRSVSTPQPGGPGGDDASSGAGGKSNDGKESRRARLRRTLRRRSKPSAPESATPQAPPPQTPAPQTPPPQTPAPQTPPPQAPPPQTPPPPAPPPQTPAPQTPPPQPPAPPAPPPQTPPRSLSTPQPGPGGEDASSEAGSKSDGKESRRARLRRRLRRRRSKPSTPESAPPPPQTPESPPPKPLFSLKAPEEEKKKPKRWSALAFRARTRLRAIRYWLREKRQIAWRGLKRAGAAPAAWWGRRSRGTKIRTSAVAGIVVLYLVIKFLPVPGVPCQVSAAKECAPSNDTIAYVPRHAVLYAHMTINSDSHQWELAQGLGDELPNFTALLQSDTSALSGPAGRPLDLSREVLPWVKDDLALLAVRGPKGTTPEAYIAGVGDAAKANQFAASLSPGGHAKQAKIGDASLSVYSNGVATGRSGDQLVFGNVAAVRAALAAKAGKLPKLEGSDHDKAREGLPDVRLAEIYLSRAGVQRFLGVGGTGATQLDTFVDYGATSGMAAAARARDDGVEVNLVSELDPALEKKSPTVFANLPRFEPGLADEAGPRALGYIGVGDLGPAINKALTTAGAGAQGLAGSLRGLARSLQKQAGVDPLKDLLPALGGQAALVAEPTGSVPYASLIVDGVDEKKAGEALASLQRPLLRSLSAGGAQVPSFRTSEVDGVTVHSIQASPSVDLSYAIFDGKLVVSTQPEGISQVRSSGDNLAGTSAFEDATDRLPDQVSALVFLNLDEVLGLAQQAGLADNPLYASLSEDILRVGSLGLAVRGSEDELQSELFLAIHD